MKKDVPELLFASREDFRSWLEKNAETSDGVWLTFDKTEAAKTLGANDALEEALCFGWIDGQMRRVDSARYLKYFARRRLKSPWSEKNKKLVAMLREKGRMTALGEKAVAEAVKHGTWSAPKRSPITTEQIEAFAEKLKGLSPAYENFAKMAPSVRATYTGRYLSFKSEEARQRDFLRIVERLDKNQKPM